MTNRRGLHGDEGMSLSAQFFETWSLQVLDFSKDTAPHYPTFVLLAEVKLQDALVKVKIPFAYPEEQRH